MEQGKKKSKLKIIIPIVMSIVIIAVVGVVFFISNNKEKVYKIGETVITDDWEFTLKDVQYGKSIITSLSEEDYCLPNEKGSHKAETGNTFVVITYNIKFLGKANTNLNAGFTLDFDNGYIIKNNSNLLPSLHLRNGIQAGTMIGNRYQSIWDIKNDMYEFKPLEQEKTIREYIEVPDNIINETEKSLKLVKTLKKSGSILQGSGGTITYDIRNAES